MPRTKNKFTLAVSAKERVVFNKLNSYLKIQDYLDALPINFEKSGDTCYSPRMLMQNNQAHCIEAALFAAAVLMWHGQPAWLIDLQADKSDYDHVVCAFKHKGLWGALSKSNHHALRFRDPIYKSVRELVMSYFHEYLSLDGKKSLRQYSKPFSLNKYQDDWVVADYDLWQIANDLDDAPHLSVLPKKFKPRPADKFEAKISNLSEWV